MSRFAEIMQNHEELDQLTALLKHYGVNAQFVTASILEQFEQKSQDDQQTQSEDLITDLKQLFSNY